MGFESGRGIPGVGMGAIMDGRRRDELGLKFAREVTSTLRMSHVTNVHAI